MVPSVIEPIKSNSGQISSVSLISTLLLFSFSPSDLLLANRHGSSGTSQRHSLKLRETDFELNSSSWPTTES